MDNYCHGWIKYRFLFIRNSGARGPRSGEPPRQTTRHACNFVGRRVAIFGLFASRAILDASTPCYFDFRRAHISRFLAHYEIQIGNVCLINWDGWLF